MKQSSRDPKDYYPVPVQKAVMNTPGAEFISPHYIKLTVSRYQKPEQSGMISVRTGVFYLPELKSPYQRHYRNGKSYGGSQYISGTIVCKQPYVLKAGTGGLGPEKAFIELYGKDTHKELVDDIFKMVVNRGGWGRTYHRSVYEEWIGEFMEKWIGEEDIDYDVIYNIAEYSREGNRMRYALQENIIAHKLREKGYDSVISYSTSGGDFRLSEVFDLRQMEYPSESGFHVEKHNHMMITSYKMYCESVMVNEGVFTNYLKVVKKIEIQEKLLKRYESGPDYNGIKADSIRKVLDTLREKEYNYLNKFTEEDKSKWEEYFGVPFEQ